MLSSVKVSSVHWRVLQLPPGRHGPLPRIICQASGLRTAANRQHAPKARRDLSVSVGMPCDDGTVWHFTDYRYRWTPSRTGLHVLQMSSSVQRPDAAAQLDQSWLLMPAV